MLVYAGSSEEQARRGYDDAMRIGEQRAALVQGSVYVTPDKFLAQHEVETLRPQ